MTLENLAVSDCFSVAEIIFISNSVQLLFVREGMRQDTVYFDGFVFFFFLPRPPFRAGIRGLMFTAILGRLNR